MQDSVDNDVLTGVRVSLRELADFLRKNNIRHTVRSSFDGEDHFGPGEIEYLRVIENEEDEGNDDDDAVEPGPTLVISHQSSNPFVAGAKHTVRKYPSRFHEAFLSSEGFSIVGRDSSALPVSFHRFVEVSVTPVTRDTSGIRP